MKKGQGAMEFLMTYGWAILVVLVAIGALFYFYNPISEMVDNFDTQSEAEERALELECDGTHFHEARNKYMPCETHSRYLEVKDA